MVVELKTKQPINRWQTMIEQLKNTAVKVENEQQWNGEGNPPVGEVVMYFSHEMKEYRECVIACTWKSNFIIVDTEDDSCEIAHLHNIKPIQAEREKFIEQSVRIATKENSDLYVTDNMKRAFGAQYDAGARFND